MRRRVQPQPIDAADTLQKAAARARWNRWKDRQDRGAFVVPVELDNVLVGRMLDLGLVTERDSTNKAKLGCALALYLANAFGDSPLNWDDDGLR